ncbi:MAG TPA: peroxiredoxin family protein [Thermoplasmata archaeon]|nr:peroxiredoxin family protein [Thermoplasmata archaeon]
MLRTGDAAPEINATTADGRPFRLSGLRGSRVVLYFFPKAFTRGCAAETRGFASVYGELRQRGVEVVGISVDDPTVQREFAEECRADFVMIGDRDRAIARSYGVLNLIGLAKRVTFFLNENGVVQDIVQSILPDSHLQRARSSFLTGGGSPPSRPAPATDGSGSSA